MAVQRVVSTTRECPARRVPTGDPVTVPANTIVTITQSLGGNYTIVYGGNMLRVDGTAPHFMIELTRPGNLDEAVVKVEIREQDFSDKMEEMHRLRDRIGREISSITGIHFTIELVEPNTLERFTGKAKRVLDLRNLKC